MSKLNSTQQAIVDAITKLNGEATIKQISDEIGKAEKTVSNNMPEMLSNAILERSTRPKEEGKGMEVTYKVILQEIEGKDGKKKKVPPPPSAEPVLPGNKKVNTAPEAVEEPTQEPKQQPKAKAKAKTPAKAKESTKKVAAPKPAKEPKAKKAKEPKLSAAESAFFDLKMTPVNEKKENKEPIEIAWRYKGVMGKGLFLDGTIMVGKKQYTPWQLWKEISGGGTSAWKKFFFVNTDGNLESLQKYMPESRKRS